MSSARQKSRSRKAAKMRSTDATTSSSSKQASQPSRILTPADTDNSLHAAPQARTAGGSGSTRRSDISSHKSRTPSLAIPKPATATAATTSGTTQAFPTSTSIPTPTSPVLSATSATALLTQISTPERNPSHSRRSSIHTTPATSDAPEVGISRSSSLRRAANSSEQGDMPSDDRDSILRGTPIKASHDRSASTPSLLRQKAKTTLSVDRSTQANNDAMSPSLFAPPSHLIGEPDAISSSLSGDPLPVSGEHKDPQITGLVDAGVEAGEALQSLKRLGTTGESSTAATGHNRHQGDSVASPDAQKLLAYVPAIATDVPSQGQSTLHPHLGGAHSQAALFNYEDMRVRQDDFERFQGQIERNERGLLADHTSQRSCHSASTSPSELVEQFIESPEPRLRRRHNFPTSQRSTDIEDEVSADVTHGVKLSTGVVKKTGSGTSRVKATDIFGSPSDKDLAGRDKETKQPGPQPDQSLDSHNNPSNNHPTDCTAPVTVRGSDHPRKLTAIERQIKEDSARVHAVTGKGRPGYEGSSDRSRKLPINVAVNVHISLPEGNPFRRRKQTQRKLRASLPSNSLTLDMRCAVLEIAKDSLAGQLVLFVLTFAVWLVHLSGVSA